jgi:hypothetical protein
MEQSILTDIKNAAKKSLKARHNELADTHRQMDILNGDLLPMGNFPI